MGRVTRAITAFNAGELTPLVAGRVDIEPYNRGCKTLLNFIPLPQGPARKRLGSRFIGEVKDHTKEVRLIEFIFSEVDSYILEFGHQYIRFYTSRDRVYEAAQDISAITKANPGVLTYVGADPSNGDWVYLSGIGGMTELNGVMAVVANVNAGANTFELKDTSGANINTTSYTTYTSGGTIKPVYEIASPYTESDLPNIKYAQLGDIMYLTCGGTTHRPQKLSRAGATSWTIANMDNLGGPVLDWPEDRTITLTPSATTGSITVTASSSTFQSTHVGSVWEFRDASDTLSTRGYARMTAYASGTSATFAVQGGALYGTGASKYWREAAWSGVQGYPRAVSFHESRLAFSGTNEKPLTVWLSATNEAYETFDAADPTDESGALQLAVAGPKNTIQWMVSDTDFLVCGTYGGLTFLGGGSSGALTATNIKARNGTTFGSNSTQGITFNDRIKYAQRSGTKVYEAEYDDLTLKYKSNNLNILNDVILDDGVVQFAVQEEPIPVLWIVRADGALVSMTQEIEQGVTAWSRHLTGVREDGTYDDFESVAVIPGSKFDEVWVAVARSIDGGTKRYIEYIEPDIDTVFYVDSGISYSGAATTTITGLSHLEGEIVDVLVNGSGHPQRTVSGGSITLNRSATTAVVGRPYSADLEPMLLEGGGDNGPAQGKLKRVHEIVVRLYKTLGLKVGKDFDDLKEIPFRSVGDPMDTVPALFGNPQPEDMTIPFSGTWDTEGNIAIRHDYPLPCTITGIYPRFVTNDK